MDLDNVVIAALEQVLSWDMAEESIPAALAAQTSALRHVTTEECESQFCCG